MKSLEKDIEYLSRMDAARTKLCSLRHDGIHALLGASPTGAGQPSSPVVMPEDSRVRWEDWLSGGKGEPLGSPMVRVLLRRIKHLAWSVDDPQSASMDEARFPALPKLEIEELFHDSDERTPVFLAAEFLRTALDESTGMITKAELLCYYRILRELFTVNSPDWTVGGARAGEYRDGTVGASAFVTHECARALHTLQTKLKKTAAFLQLVTKSLHYVEHVRACWKEGRIATLKAQWCDLEFERLALELRARSTTASSHSLLWIELPQPSMPSAKPTGAADECDSVLEAIRLAVQKFVNGVESAFLTALADIDRHRLSVEQPLPKSGEAVKRQFFESTSAHERARASLLPAQELVRKIRDETFDDSPNGMAKLFQLVGKGCERTARGIGELLDPTCAFVEGVCRRSVLEYDTNRAVGDIPELAFAAACWGTLTGNWKDPVHRRILLALGTSLDGRGRFPMGRPFHLTSAGGQLNPVNAHVIRAFMEIAGHVDVDIDCAVVRRFIDYFEDESVSLGGGVHAWGRGRAVRRKFPAVWVTAVTTLAMHRVIKMLDRKINEGVMRHFVWTAPQAISAPVIDDLMCTDIGLSSLDAPVARPRRRTATVDLTLMLAHLNGRRAVAATNRPNVFSAVLYGPPGTGKTSLIESLAKTAERPLINLSPSDFIVHGSEHLEKRSADVMRALSMLTDCVLIFDEFDDVLRARGGNHEPPQSTFGFLSGCMLPKIKALRDAAERNRVVYALATNYFERLDDAAVRPGRFDYRIGVFPPDPQSRLCRLVSEFRRWCRSESIEFVARGNGTKTERSRAGLLLTETDLRTIERRMLRVVALTGGVPVVELCKRGWFTAPKNVSPGTVWGYLLGGIGKFPACAESSIEWPLPSRRSAYPDVEDLFLAAQAGLDRAVEYMRDHGRGGDSQRQSSLENDLVVRQVWGTRIVDRWNEEFGRQAPNGEFPASGVRAERSEWAKLLDSLCDEGATGRDLAVLDTVLDCIRIQRRAGATPLHAPAAERRSATRSGAGASSDERNSGKSTKLRRYTVKPARASKKHAKGAARLSPHKRGAMKATNRREGGRGRTTKARK